jgi:competence protein CoiA
MQLIAWDQHGPIRAAHAEKHIDYCCPECGSLLRVRSGPHRQPHFYHLEANPACTQHRKSAEHLQAQLTLCALLPEGEGKLEHPFPSIGRIADVCWEERKIVFEIQYSPLPQEEAEARCTDYRSIGYEPVWILHDARFNKTKLSAAENYLRRSTCYFTNLTAHGEGIFYDQDDHCNGAIRIRKSPPLRVHLDQPKRVAHENLADRLRKRYRHWTLHFTGDCLDRWSKSPPVEQAIPSRSISLTGMLKKLHQGYLAGLLSLLKQLSATKK